MRSSHAPWILAGLIAATACLETGCVGSRLSKGIGGMQASRPRLLGGRQSNSGTQTASTKPQPPASSIPPAGLEPKATAQTFPGQPAPGSQSSASGYAATGGATYESTADRRGGYDDGYASTPASGRGSDAGGNAQPQQGFYGNEYGGGSTRFSDSHPRGGADYGYGDRGFDDRGRGYDDRGGNYGAAAGGAYGGASGSYGQPYAGSGGRDYHEVADSRGDDRYNDQRTAGGNQGSYGSYGSNIGAGEGRYDAPSDSRYASPPGGASEYDYRNPAAGHYNSGNYSGGNFSDQGYSRFSSGEQSYDAGDRYHSHPQSVQPSSAQPNSHSPYGSPPQGSFNQHPAGAGTSPAGFFPGSSKPYTQPQGPPSSSGQNGPSRW